MAWLTALSISWRLISETMSKDESCGMGRGLYRFSAISQTGRAIRYDGTAWESRSSSVGVLVALATAAGFLILVGYFVWHRLDDWRDARTAQRLSQEARRDRIPTIEGN